MAIKPLASMNADWFTPPGEEEEERPTRFKVKPLDSAQLDQALDRATYDEKGNILDLSPQGKIMALRFGLIGWENFGDLKCNFTNHNKLPWPIRYQIAMHIINSSFVTEDDEKN